MDRLPGDARRTAQAVATPGKGGNIADSAKKPAPRERPRRCRAPPRPPARRRISLHPRMPTARRRHKQITRFDRHHHAAEAMQPAPRLHDRHLEKLVITVIHRLSGSQRRRRPAWPRFRADPDPVECASPSRTTPRRLPLRPHAPRKAENDGLIGRDRPGRRPRRHSTGTSRTPPE